MEGKHRREVGSQEECSASFQVEKGKSLQCWIFHLGILRVHTAQKKIHLMTNPISQKKVALALTSQIFQALQERGSIVLFVSTMHTTERRVRAPFALAGTAQGHAVSPPCL